MNRLFKTISMVVTASVVLSTPIAGLKLKTVRADGLSIQDTSNFPDTEFQNYIHEEFDTDKDWFLSDEERNSVTSIETDNKNITSLKGIELFPNMTTISCKNCGLADLDVSGCKALKYLYCSGNQLTELDVSACSALSNILCSSNKLLKLDVSKNTALKSLYCDYTDLTVLDVSNCTALKYLNCSHVSNLINLDLSKNTSLEQVFCSYNDKLTSLNVSNIPSLSYLNCDGDKLTDLNVRGCTALHALDCRRNQLTELDLSGCTSLTQLYCHGNKIPFVNVEESTPLKEKMETLEVVSSVLDGYKVTLYQEQGPNYTVYYISTDVATDLLNGMPIDSTFPDEKFRGYVSENFDLDHNGLLDSSERKAVKVIDVHGLGISDLTGVELFTELEELYCQNNDLAKLELSANTKLMVLDCSQNQLAALDVSANTALKKLYCFGNKISKLSIEKCGALLEEYKKCVKFTVKDAKSGITYFEFKTDENEPCLKIDTKTGIVPNVLIPTPTNTPTPSPSPSPKPATPKPTGATPKPTGATPKPTGATPKPTGATPKPTGATPKPTGVTPKPTGVTPKPTGVTPKPTSATPKPTGVTPKPTGATPKPTGVTPKPTGVTPKPGDPTPTPDPEKEPSIADFVERLYTIALARESEPEGKAFWVNEIESGNRTGGDCAHFFLIEAQEFLNRGLTDEDFVETLYLTFFDRASEPAGKKFWVDSLKSGRMTKENVINGFIDSTEWCNVCATYGVKSGAPNAKAEFASKNAIMFATRLYTCCLGRAPEEGGLKYWSLALTNLEQTGCSAAKEFFTSAEFIGFKLKDNEYVRRLYTTFMGREPEASEVDYWVGAIAEGTQTKESVMAFFGQSEEFTNICKQYGIDRGTI